MSEGKKVLNLFAYTGSFSVCAALGGASEVWTVDMSNTYLRWARRNFTLNKIFAGPHKLNEKIFSRRAALVFPRNLRRHHSGSAHLLQQ